MSSLKTLSENLGKGKNRSHGFFRKHKNRVVSVKGSTKGRCDAVENSLVTLVRTAKRSKFAEIVRRLYMG